MKKALILGLSLVLCVSLLAGCRGNKAPMETTMPTTAPATAPSTTPTTMPTVQPSETTLPTTGTTPDETMDWGNGPMDATDSTTGTGSSQEGRSRNPMPKGK